MEHREFIITPLRHIIEDATYNFAAQDWSIETFPIIEHYFISLFLKLTGASEQKMKCICWDMATDDYDYRYKTFTQNSLGECSCYDEKKKVINDIYLQILKFKPDFDLNTEINKTDILSIVRKTVDTFYKYSKIEVIYAKEYAEYSNYINNISTLYFLVKNPDKNVNNLFLLVEQKQDKVHITNKDLRSIFEIGYRFRNRCAHNTLSYQENQIPLSEYTSDNYLYENYFFRFALIILIDEIVIALYQKYLEVK